MARAARSQRPSPAGAQEVWEDVKADVKSTAREVQTTLESTADVALTTPPSTASPSGTSSIPGPWSTPETPAVSPVSATARAGFEPPMIERPTARTEAAQRLAEALASARSAGPTTADASSASTPSEEAIDKLDQCLRGELSGVETYDLALQHLVDPALAAELNRIRESHAARVEVLRARILTFGAAPSASSGPWGAFTRLVLRGADLFGDRAAFAALEEGEAHGIKLYTEELDALEPESYALVTRVLLPEQERTHAMCRALSVSRRAA